MQEPNLEKQVLAVFDKMRVEDEGVRGWFRMVLASQTRDTQADSQAAATGQSLDAGEKWQRDLNRVNAYLIDNCGYPNAYATIEPNFLNLKTSVNLVKSQNLEIKSGRQDLNLLPLAPKNVSKHVEKPRETSRFPHFFRHLFRPFLSRRKTPVFRQVTMSSRNAPSVVVLDEPLLEFGFGQRVASPRPRGV